MQRLDGAEGTQKPRSLFEPPQLRPAAQRTRNVGNLGTDPAVNLAKEQASLEQRIAAVTNSTANLVSQLRDLDEVRERTLMAQSEGLLIFSVQSNGTLPR